MHFCDEVKVKFIAGKGGDGCIGFRREKFIPKGGPDGGDGGNGGSIYLEVDSNRNTLSEFDTYKIFRALSGKPGKGSNMHGKNAEDLFLKVPPGTLVINPDTKEVLADLKDVKEKFCAARGGRGGYGNSHFTTSTRQAPRFAELGEPGEEKEAILELKLVADVGVIGLPSAGKSSFISRISSAKPKIADYPFTTLIPNLGVAYLNKFGGEPYESFVVCDLPGLIEGAHLGKGLGIEFLKHIARNRILLHILDGSRDNLAEDCNTILNELREFDPQLRNKKTLVVINKIDLLSKEEREKKRNALLKALPEFKDSIFLISCVTSEGLRELVFAIHSELKKIPKEIEKPFIDEKYKIFRPHLEEDPDAFEVNSLKEKEGKKQFRISGKRIEQIAVMTDTHNQEAVSRLYDVMKKMGIQRELLRQGAKENDEIIIRKITLPFIPV